MNLNDPRRLILTHEARRQANDRALQNPDTSAHWCAALNLIRRERLPEPQGEYMFTPRREWRFDLCWPEFLIAIETHGQTHARGRHTRGTGFAEDRKKMNEAQRLMWRVFEITPEMLDDTKTTYFVDLLKEVFNRDN